MPNYRYNTPDYMRQNHRPHRPVRAVIFTITTN